ncbi:hypothetical protein J6Q66_07625 [bacterium]|nr:hypothetical protein [bacterium]
MQINKISVFKNNTPQEQQKSKNISFGFYAPRGFWSERNFYIPIPKIKTERPRISGRNESYVFTQLKAKYIEQITKRLEKEEHKEFIKLVKCYLCESTQVRHVKDVERILDLFNIRTQKTNSGNLIIEKFKQPDSKLTFKELDIDENKMFQFIERIHGNADFSRSNVNNLGNLKSIGGDVLLKNSQLTPDNFKNIKVSGEIKE